MGFGHRKLLHETETESESPSPSQSINSTMPTQTISNPLCEPFCDPINVSGYCLGSCLNICPVTCRYAFPIGTDYSPPPPPPPPPARNHRHVSPLLITTFVALSLAVLIVIGYVVYVRLYGRGQNRGGGRSRAQPQRAAVPPRDDEFFDDLRPVLDHPIWYIHTVGLQPSVISKITICKYKRSEGLIEGTDCSVCLTEFEEDETVRLLPKCSHAFHVPCIDTWLRSHKNCPNCRAPIITGAARSPSPEPSAAVNSWEEIRLDEGGGDVESGGEVERSAAESRRVTESEAEELAAGGRLEDEADEIKNGTIQQPIRRSVSVSSLSAAKINLAVADFLSARKSDSESGDEKNQAETAAMNKGPADGSNSSSAGRSVQFLSGSSSSTARSLSWSGRFLSAKHGWIRGSIPPPQ